MRINDNCCICQHSLDGGDNTNDGIICRQCDSEGLKPDEYGS